MLNLKCKMCGGSLEISPGETVAVCEYCGTRQTLPKLDNERIAALYERAELLRKNNDFDKAASVYEQIVLAAPTDAEAYWSLVLCRYGIEYVEDPASHKRIPTINRIQYGSVLEDVDYLSALQHADPEQRTVYEAEARTIETIQRGYLSISGKEKPFDVFLCYKESDSSGRRTPDSVLAAELYHQLVRENFKVFFSRITLEDKLGTEYEPYIFAALHSAKVMVVLGTKPEYFQAVWVRNEWARFLSLIRSGEEKVLIPAYRDMNAYDLPEEFANLQALDMSRLGFVQDLLHGIKKIVGDALPAEAAEQAAAAPLLRRAFLFLEDGDWKTADEYCEKVLDREPEHGRAYLGKLMAALQVRKEADLQKLEQPFDDHPLYEKILRFGDAGLTEDLNGYNEAIRERQLLAQEAARRQAELEKARLEEARRQKEEQRLQAKQERKEKRNAQAGRYRKVWLRVLCACLAVALIAGSVFWWKTGEAQRQAAYEAAAALMTKGEYAAAAEAFGDLGNYLDSAEQKAKAEQILEDARLVEEAYGAAVELLEAEEYSAAVDALTALGDYRDSKVLLQQAEAGWKNEQDYETAAQLTAEGDYRSAMVVWDTLGDFRDSRAQYAYCGTQSQWEQFRACLDSVETVEFEQAVSHLEAMAAYDGEETGTYLDDGYYELAELAFGAERADLAEQYLAAVAEPGRFEHYETLAEEIGWLKLYQEAQTIEVKNNDSKAALQAILDQLPEDYRDVAGLKKKIADYDAAVAAAAAAAAEAEEKRKEEAELEEWNKKLIGTWVSSDGFLTLIMNADGTYTEKENGVVVRYGTYGVCYIFPDKDKIQVYYAVPKELTEKTGVKGISHNLSNITETSFTMTGHVNSTIYFIRR